MVKSGKILIFPSIALPQCLFISEFRKEDKANHLFLSHCPSSYVVQTPPVCSLMCRWNKLFCCPQSEGRELEAAELKDMAAWSENGAGQYSLLFIISQYLFSNGTSRLAWRVRMWHDKNRKDKEVISQIFTFAAALAGKWRARFQNLTSFFMPVICRRMWMELIVGGI